MNTMKEKDRIKFRHLNRLKCGDCIRVGSKFYLKSCASFVNLKTGSPVNDKRIWKGKEIMKATMFIW